MGILESLENINSDARIQFSVSIHTRAISSLMILHRAILESDCPINECLESFTCSTRVNMASDDPPEINPVITVPSRNASRSTWLLMIFYRIIPLIWLSSDGIPQLTHRDRCLRGRGHVAGGAGLPVVDHLSAAGIRVKVQESVTVIPKIHVQDLGVVMWGVLCPVFGLPRE